MNMLINVGTFGILTLLWLGFAAALLRLYANDVLIAEASDATFTRGDIGLIAGTFDEPGTDILFDNLRVLRP